MVGKALIVAGAVVLLVGIVIQYAPGLVSWFGKLPGDINITRDGTRIFIPITSMIIVSLILTVVINLFFRR